MNEDKFPTGQFFLCQSNQFPNTELVFDNDCTMTAEEAVAHAINFWTSPEHYLDVDPGDKVRISRPFPLAADTGETFTITDEHIQAAGEL